MVVWVEPALGFFFRINTEDKWQTPVKLIRVPDHLFLKHDSHLECGDPLELDDYVIEQALNGQGVIGQVSRTLVPAILEAVKTAKTLSERDKAAIRAALS